MSLLVIVGHVKDGIAMAREHGLPRNIQHFIDAHHGTTLVEYFYKRARKQAIGVDDMGKTRPSTGEPAVEIEGERLPEEVDYRYPGPKPQTKEVAILMLADAVESATRTLAEPTPADRRAGPRPGQPTPDGRAVRRVRPDAPRAAGDRRVDQQDRRLDLPRQDLVLR